MVPLSQTTEGEGDGVPKQEMFFSTSVHDHLKVQTGVLRRDG